MMVSTLPRKIEDNQKLVETTASNELFSLLKKSSMKLRIEDKKKADVATSSLLIIFKSVFISLSLVNISELVLLGMIENTENRNAVAIEEKESDADIMSV